MKKKTFNHFFVSWDHHSGRESEDSPTITVEMHSRTLFMKSIFDQFCY